MTQAFVYDRCIDAARQTCDQLGRERVPGFAMLPDAFDPTFHPGGAPHLIVTELDMSPVGGLELIRQVRSYWSAAELPIVVYTSASDVATLAEAKAAGAHAVVTKDGPDAPARLVAAVERCLRRTIPALVEPVRPAGALWRLFAAPFRGDRAAA